MSGNHKWQVGTRRPDGSRKEINDSPWRPTISATCSDEGTGTHSVVFWDFFVGQLSRDPSGSANALARESESEDDRPNIESSRASWRALWSSRHPDPFPMEPLETGCPWGPTWMPFGTCSTDPEWGWWCNSWNRLAGITVSQSFFFLS